jgi:hypothetical protein
MAPGGDSREEWMPGHRWHINELPIEIVFHFIQTFGSRVKPIRAVAYKPSSKAGAVVSSKIKLLS